MSVLGIPVDHRLRDTIRELMKLNEAPSSSSPSSNHCERLRQLSQYMRHRGWSILENEVEFACYLAELAVQGGIVVALTQPPQYQDYSIPTNDIVENCNTLLALQKLAEFFSLPFDRLSILDAYPFITEKELDQEDVDHAESHTALYEMILEKRPTVVLTGWTSPSFGDFTTKSLWKRAIGAVFPSPTIRYCGLTFSMVNMPHPSYYMNYHPTKSCFRQLQILEFAQACGRLWGTWQEKAWMADLRGKCRARAKFLFDSKFDSSSIFICVNQGDRCDSLDEAFVTKRLTQTLTRLGPALAGMRYSFSSKAQIKDHISKNNILELCLDASLILRHVDVIFSDTKNVGCAEASMTFLCTWYECRWPALSESSVPTSAGLPGIYAHGCFDRIPVVDMPPLARQIESCLMSFAKKMNLSWICHGDDNFEADFEAQSSAFFKLAKGIEDAMDEILDNIRIQGKTRDELAIALEALNLQESVSQVHPQERRPIQNQDNDSNGGLIPQYDALEHASAQRRIGFLQWTSKQLKPCCLLVPWCLSGRISERDLIPLSASRIAGAGTVEGSGVQGEGYQMHGWNTTKVNGEVVIESRHEAHHIYGKQFVDYTINNVH